MVTVNARHALGKLHNDTTSYRKTRRVRRCVAGARRSGASPAHGHQMHELGSIDVMRLDRTLQSRHVACASSCISMRTSLEEGIKLHRFAGMFPEQFLTEAGRQREAVVAADQRMVIRCFRDDLAGFVHDVSHVPPPIQRAGLVDAPFWRHHEGRDRQSDAAEHLKGMA